MRISCRGSKSPVSVRLCELCKTGDGENAKRGKMGRDYM